ncbi:MAG: non-canonical purine NTP pyrophosphatase [Deltaproteobacteria bacterium]|nr:non-canonical purine NTP pyrophosphatase [Deltaproteobacteria bacterium]
MTTSWQLATGNAHKAEEILAIVSAFGVTLRTPKAAGLTLEVDEWATTFAANAVVKAVAYARATGLPALADDSGIAIDAFDGAPGVYSARFAGPDASDADNNARMVRELLLRGKRTSPARYHCVIALALPTGDAARADERDLIAAAASDGLGLDLGDLTLHTFSGTMEGAVCDTAEGQGGFGYDPYFRLPDGRPLATLSAADKNALSHRGAALAKLRAWLEQSGPRG